MSITTWVQRKYGVVSSSIINKISAEYNDVACKLIRVLTESDSETVLFYRGYFDARDTETYLSESVVVKRIDGKDYLVIVPARRVTTMEGYKIVFYMTRHYSDGQITRNVNLQETDDCYLIGVKLEGAYCEIMKTAVDEPMLLYSSKDLDYIMNFNLPRGFFFQKANVVHLKTSWISTKDASVRSLYADYINTKSGRLKIDNAVVSDKFVAESVEATNIKCLGRMSCSKIVDSRGSIAVFGKGLLHGVIDALYPDETMLYIEFNNAVSDLSSNGKLPVSVRHVKSDVVGKTFSIKGVFCTFHFPIPKAYESSSFSFTGSKYLPDDTYPSRFCITKLQPETHNGERVLVAVIAWFFDDYVPIAGLTSARHEIKEIFFIG